jgi:hypothetical protein
MVKPSDDETVRIVMVSAYIPQILESGTAIVALCALALQSSPKADAVEGEHLRTARLAALELFDLH